MYDQRQLISERLEPYYAAAERESAERESHMEQPWLEAQVENRRQFSPGLIATLVKDPRVAVIAEHKRHSPSEGDIRPDSSIAWTVEQYERGGATALSILTQGEHFKGRIDDLSTAWSHSDLPVLRKDFMRNEYQLREARAHGADAALLIVGGLSDERLESMMQEATYNGLECLVEVHNDEELDRALAVQPSLIGINNRDLTVMETNLETTQQLRKKVPDDIPVVAESGYNVRNPEHMRMLRNLGVSAVLMGTALMREADPAQALSDWLATK